MKDYKIAVNKRVLECITFLLRFEKQAEICYNLGVKPAKFSEIMNERMAAGIDIIQNLCIQYNISPAWILLGEGEMLRTEEASAAAPETANSNVTTLINMLNSTLAEKDRQIDRLLSIIEKNNLK